MEIELTGIDFTADIFDVCRAVSAVLRGHHLYDPNDDRQVLIYQISMVRGTPGHIHGGKAILRVGPKLGLRLIKWTLESEENNIVVMGRPLTFFNIFTTVPLDVKLKLGKTLLMDPDWGWLRSRLEELIRLVRSQIEKVQIGVWYKPSNSRKQRATFSVEYERDFLTSSAANIYLEYGHQLIHIDICQRETGEINYKILVKFSSIRKLGLGYDESGQAFIILDLRTPPNFEQSYKSRTSEGIKRRVKFKTRDRISAIDAAHARIAPYAHHLRILLADPNDLPKIENICHITQCEPRPIRIPCVDACAMELFSHSGLVQVQRWIKTMDWKSAFQIEACLRSGLLTSHDLLVTLQKPIEQAIHFYGDETPEFLRLFSIALKMRNVDEELGDCFARTRSNHAIIKPLRLAPGHISCRHVIITPSKILLEGPYTTRSNRVIRHYQSHDPNFVERFIRVEFRDEDCLPYSWEGEVDFLKQRVGGILRQGFELGGRAFEFLAYSMSALREHAVWFVSPFRDPVEGYVTAEKIRASLGDFSKLLRMPSKYAARIAQAFTATDPSVKIRRDQWEEQDDLGNHTDGVGTISPQLADMIWEAKFNATRNVREHRVRPSAYQFRFLGYKGVVVVDHRLQGIRMRLRQSQRKFPVQDVEEAEFEIACFYDYPNPAHLDRPVVMVLEDRGVDKEAFIALQERVKASINLSIHSLGQFSQLLTEHNLGGNFHLAFILKQLNKLGLAFEDGTDKKAIKCAFFEHLLRFSINYSLRRIKFKARIPVPESYHLVGVADEGQAYIKEGIANKDDVYTLGPARIYVCVQESPHEQPIYLKGICVISRSPAIHPGDVQFVYAVGEPPEDKICFFRGLKNVVVLPAVGKRSLASCLAGGDLDGDTYDIYCGNPRLIPKVQITPADEKISAPWTLDEERDDATVNDICDFIVEYINNDVMGILADRHIVIADQSKDGVFDERCMKLAKLCSKAVDYAMHGNPVDMYSNLPKPLIKFEPDWRKQEVTGARAPDYYVSERALGYMFRNIRLPDPDNPIEGLPTGYPEATAPLKDPISLVLAPLIQRTLKSDADVDSAEPGAESENSEAELLHAHYVREMRYICVAHTLVDAPDFHLQEEEVVLGVILAKCVQSRWRTDRTYRMKLHVEGLVNEIRGEIIQSEKMTTEDQLRSGLLRAWEVWAWAQHHQDREFIESFSLIVLGLMFDYLTRLGGLPQA